MKIIGTLLFGASLVFIGYFVSQHWSDIEGVARPSYALASVALYAPAVVVTALLWPILLGAPIWKLVQIGLISQVGKYVPGNIAHYLGRAALSKSVNIPLGDSAKFTALEVVLAIIGSAIVGLATYSALASLAVLLAALLLSGRWRIPLALVCTSILMGGMSFALMASSVGPVEFVPLVSIFAGAWLVGYITPGAPAGLGLRESVLIAALSPMLGPGPAITASLLHRLATAITDALIAAIAYSFWRRS